MVRIDICGRASAGTGRQIQRLFVGASYIRPEHIRTTNDGLTTLYVYGEAAELKLWLGDIVKRLEPVRIEKRIIPA